MWHALETGKDAYSVMVGRSEGKRPLGRPWPRQEYNIKIDLQKVRWGSKDWSDLARERDGWQALVNAVMNLGFHKIGEFF
jgi:hypothetical protein